MCEAVLTACLDDWLTQYTNNLRVWYQNVDPQQPLYGGPLICVCPKISDPEMVMDMITKPVPCLTYTLSRRQMLVPTVVTLLQKHRDATRGWEDIWSLMQMEGISYDSACHRMVANFMDYLQFGWYQKKAIQIVTICRIDDRDTFDSAGSANNAYTTYAAWCPYQAWGNKCILLGVLTKKGGTNAFCLVSLPIMGEQMHFAWCPHLEWGNKCILLGVLTKNGGTNAFCLVGWWIRNRKPSSFSN